MQENPWNNLKLPEGGLKGDFDEPIIEPPRVDVGEASIPVRREGEHE